MTFEEQCREVYEQWRRKAAIIATVMLTCVIFYHVVFGANGWVVYQKKKVEYKQLQDDLQKLSKENDALQKDVKALKTDKSAIEREAREQLHYTRPGEVVYVMPQGQNSGGNPPAAATAQKR
jgi:cell division protein FtsB